VVHCLPCSYTQGETYDMLYSSVQVVLVSNSCLIHCRLIIPRLSMASSQDIASWPPMNKRWSHQTGSGSTCCLLQSHTRRLDSRYEPGNFHFSSCQIHTITSVSNGGEFIERILHYQLKELLQ